MRVLAVIPARWGSTRFPGKPLASLAGRPLVEHVYRRAGRARLVDRVLVATDDSRILEAVREFGGEAILTAGTHSSGSDRVAEVARQVDSEVVVNVQGDEALLEPAAIDAAVEPLLLDPSLDAATLAAPMASAEVSASPHVVKVVLDLRGNALYFSRAPIPFSRAEGKEKTGPLLHHIGLYAYRRSFLLEYTSWPPTPLEIEEHLEQLRILEHGRTLRVVQVEKAFPGVDTPGDLDRVARLLAAPSA
jgi:3-deoxy-manno-octulosonate cytidylyltransferase (CMP-KDO synthetase)